MARFDLSTMNCVCKLLLVMSCLCEAGKLSFAERTETSLKCHICDELTCKDWNEKSEPRVGFLIWKNIT